MSGQPNKQTNKSKNNIIPSHNWVILKSFFLFYACNFQLSSIVHQSFLPGIVHSNVARQ